MKKPLRKISLGLLGMALASCGATGASSSSIQSTSSDLSSFPPVTAGKVLISYFSCTGTTERIAGLIEEATGGDLHEIIPADPYTEEDLAYYTGGRADQEQADPSCRPEIDNTVEGMEDYDYVFLGYPIWHGEAPRIISTFLESYDFAGKTIIPFCTSGSSGIGNSDNDLHALAPGATWIEGERFPSGASQKDVEAWVDGLGIEFKEECDVSKFDLESGENGRAPAVTLSDGNRMPILGLGTYSLHGDECRNAVRSAIESGVRLIDTASAYGNETEIGEAIRSAIEDGLVKREELFVITKIYPGSEMANPEVSIQNCLDRLDIGYVDMMLLHHPDPNDAKAYLAMEKFVARGLIHSLGLSNYYIEEIDPFIAEVNIRPALVQNEIHIYYQEPAVVPYMHGLGIAVQAWYPFGGRGHTTEILTDPTILEIAEAHDRTAAQVILRWHLQRGVIAIPGSSDEDHIKENISVFDFALSDEEMARIASLNRDEKYDWY